MRRPPRHLVGAAGAGVLVATVAVAAVLAAAGGDSPATDGEFVLDRPGVYEEPVETVEARGQRLPALALIDAEGRTRPLSEFAGRPLVVNVWYSSCPPCARELRDFADVAAELDGQIQFVGVDPVDDGPAMVAFADERGVTYPLLLDTTGEFVTDAAITRFPTTLFVSADGEILHRTNEIDAETLRSLIAVLF